MSAQPCGCDPEADWTCFVHMLDAPETSASEISDTHIPSSVPRSAEWIREAFVDTEDLSLSLSRIAEVLATFASAPLTMSSIQPILDLAVELNPGLKETK